PNIRLRFRVIHFIKQETPVARPTRGTLVLAGLEQNLLVFHTVSGLLIKVVWAVSIGAKNNAVPIRRPDRICISGRTKSKPCTRAAPREIQHPDVACGPSSLRHSQSR